MVVPIRLSNAPCFIYYKRLPITSKDSLLEKEIQKEIKINYQPIENIKAMEMVWDCGTRLFKRGGLFFNKRRIDWAILEWEKAIALNALNPSNLVQAHYWLGVSYLRKGRKEEARLQFKKVLEKEPNNKDALSILEDIQKMK
ncbi:MAG: tetratricopeptide repeat protein [bacterium]